MLFTIGIPTWNRCDLLKQTLEGLTKIDVPPGVEWEVLVCDNNSTDRTREVTESMMSRLPLRYTFEAKQGRGHALLKLGEDGRGDWLLILDDDVRVATDWMKAYAEAIAKYPDATFFGGQVLPWVVGTPDRRRMYLLRKFPWVHAVLELRHDEPIRRDGQLPHGPNMAVRRAAILEPGAIDTRIGVSGGKRISGSDTEMIFKQIDRGRTGWLIAGPKVEHYIPRERMGLRWFCQWHMGIGRRWVVLKGPAKGSGLWIWRIIARRALLIVSRWRPRDPRKSYETLGDACMWWGYYKASRRPQA